MGGSFIIRLLCMLIHTWSHVRDARNERKAHRVVDWEAFRLRTAGCTNIMLTVPSTEASKFIVKSAIPFSPPLNQIPNA